MNSINPNTGSRVRIKAFLRRMWCAATNIHRVPFYFVLTALITFAVESLSRHSPADALRFLFENPLAYLTNYGIILLTVLPALIFRKRVAGLCLLSSVWLLLGVAQCVVLIFRVSPLAAIDIAIALSVLSIISAYLNIYQIILICAGLISVIVALVLVFIRAKRYLVNWRRFAVTYVASLLGTALVILFGFTSGQLSDKFPNLANAYDDYGFPYCFGMSVVDHGVDRPDDYGSDLIADILDNLPPEQSTAESRAPNVIMVQLESFFDVKYLSGVTYSQDPVPGFTALKEQYASGLLTVPVIGAGTVNTEFEVLTGMNVADFGAGEYPFRTIMAETTCESIAYDLRACGYRTHAIHNHEGSFYLRNDIYPNLGFDSFTSVEYFEDPTFNENDWAHDSLLTDEIMYLLNSTEESDFVFAVSVQGHGKYPNDYTPKEGDVVITDGIEDDTVLSRFNYYISQIHQMDAFVTALYESVMALDEDTVLVFYGDHMPNIVLDEGITPTVDIFETEYIIISNYATPNPPSDRPLNTYQLFPAVMEAMGNSTGVINRFHTAYRDDPAYLSLLAALEYDALYGDRVAYGEQTYARTDMIMGSRPITVSDVYADGEYLYVRGENFTAYSKIALDGWSKTTEFVDRNTLRLKDKDPVRLLTRTEQVTVRQISDSNEVLSETAIYQIPPAD